MMKSNKIVLIDIDDTLFNTERLINSSFFVYELYKEVINALSELSNIATLGVFSQGEVAFQTKKNARDKYRTIFFRRSYSYNGV
jgi:hypothetical protein